MYFFEEKRNNGQAIFLTHPFLERHKILTPLEENGIPKPMENDGMLYPGHLSFENTGVRQNKETTMSLTNSGLRLLRFPVPLYRKKGVLWDKISFSLVLDRTLSAYGLRQQAMLFQSALRALPEDIYQQNQAEAALQIGELLLGGLTPEEIRSFGMVLPGDDFFLLEEELFWIRRVMESKFAEVKEMSIFIMNSGGIPPIVQEFADFLELEYGILPDVWNMKTFCTQKLLHTRGISLGILPQVIVDLDGSGGLPDFLCPSGSKYIDLFSQEKTRQRFAGEDATVRYVSPCSILDTTLNNGYNIVVN